MTICTLPPVAIKSFYREGVFVNGAAQGYLIDKKTAEQYHIKSIDQLKDPKIAKLFDTNGDGKADLTGCTPGWGCEAVINHQIDAYGLSKTVVHNQGNYAAMMADTIARFKEGKPVIYYHMDAVLGQRRAEAGQRCRLAAGSVLLPAGSAEKYRYQTG
ncbi:L-proline glycine betaine binding ABC transporter protein ProX (TC 3.A.1.12.1) [Raoultella ornithinolytica]|nr:L-proline glycine betaine binding ABC transporter protein ProX (TC 3.A.1.12.1) [Raoultella ornithinolytica]